MIWIWYWILVNVPYYWQMDRLLPMGRQKRYWEIRHCWKKMDYNCLYAFNQDVEFTNISYAFYSPVIDNFLFLK